MASSSVRKSSQLVAGVGVVLAMTGCPENPDAITEHVATVMDFPVAPFGGFAISLPKGTLTVARRVAAPGGGLWPDSLVLVVQNVEELASAQYQLWLMSEETNQIVPAQGRYEKIKIIQELDPITGEVISQRDSLVEVVTGTSTFAGQSGLFKHRMIVSNALGAGGAADTIGFYTHAVLTVETNTTDGVPSNSQPLWFRYTNQRGTPTDYRDDTSASGGLLFGTFALVGDRRIVSSMGGADGLGGILGREVSADVFDLPLPPVGYFYEGWVVGPVGDTVSTGPLTSPPPESVSLIDADVGRPHPVVVPGLGIRQTNARVALSSASDIVDCPPDPEQACIVKLDAFFVTLEPKLGVSSIGPTLGLVGPFPVERILARRGTE